MIPRKTFAAAIVAGSTALAALVPAAGAVELKLHSYILPARAESKLVQEFADEVNARGGEDVHITVYHGGTLGLKEADILRTLKAGAVDMAVLYNEYYSRDAPELALLYVQGAITDGEDHMKAMSIVMPKAIEAYGKWGIKIVGGFSTRIFDIGLHCKEPVNTLEQLQGKKVRVWSGHQVETFRRLGITAQVIPQSEMYLALQTGVIDCAVYLSAVAPAMSLGEVAKYEAFLHPLAAIPQLFAVSDRAWQRLTPEAQALLTGVGEAMLAETQAAALDPEREAADREDRASKGFVILEPFPEADRQKFLQAARAAWLDMAADTSPEAEAQAREIIAVLDAQ